MVIGVLFEMLAAVFQDRPLDYVFLGLGVAPSTPSRGQDLSGRNRLFFREAWWVAIAPGTAISLTVLGFNLFGDALRDMLDPRLRGTGRR